jgi:hypothetical protein
MKLKVTMVLFSMFLVQAAAWAGDHDPRVIAALLADSKLSLLDAVALAEQTSGISTSAKFEVDHGTLMVSVYTVPEGISTAPEAATLTEISGVASESPFQAKVAVFEDKEHIARAASHLTLMQLSRLPLRAIIKKATQYRGGTAIDVRNPTVRAGRAVADVVLVDAYLEPFTVTIDLLKGSVVR